MNNDSFETAFFQINRVLKKYMYGALEKKLLEKYITDCINAIETDSDLKIVEEIEKCCKAMETGKLEYKDKNKEKVIQQLKLIDKKFFSDYLEKKEKLLMEVKELPDLSKEVIVFDIHIQALEQFKEKTIKKPEYTLKPLQEAISSFLEIELEIEEK